MKGDCSFTTGVNLDKDGYPRVKWKKRTWRLNRLLYTFTHGPIPEGMVIGHACNNKGCINPTHLYLTTPQQNSTDAARDGLYKTGFFNKAFEEADKNWLLICKLYHEEGYSQDRIAFIFGVYQSRISEILRKYKQDYYTQQEIEDFIDED